VCFPGFQWILSLHMKLISLRGYYLYYQHNNKESVAANVATVWTLVSRVRIFSWVCMYVPPYGLPSPVPRLKGPTECVTDYTSNKTVETGTPCVCVCVCVFAVTYLPQFSFIIHIRCCKAETHACVYFVHTFLFVHAAKYPKLRRPE
jgi:hypothetical protein